MQVKLSIKQNSIYKIKTSYIQTWLLLCNALGLHAISLVVVKRWQDWNVLQQILDTPTNTQSAFSSSSPLNMKAFHNKYSKFVLYDVRIPAFPCDWPLTLWDRVGLPPLCSLALFWCWPDCLMNLRVLDSISGLCYNIPLPLSPKLNRANTYKYIFTQI
jgi:hypothetical protein